jgi:hypothetical protein
MPQTITSLVGFIRKLGATPAKKEEIFVFRGHSDRVQFKLSPSVFRNNTLHAQEKNIIRELVTLHPTEFTGDKTTLDQLVRMQHFSLPTRLLDATSNPLAALFFACKEYPSRSAEVIKFRIK